MDDELGGLAACERSEHAASVTSLAVHFRVEAAGYPAAPPTDPYVINSVIRFLGNQSGDTTLTHDFATLQTSIRFDERFWARVEDRSYKGL